MEPARGCKMTALSLARQLARHEVTNFIRDHIKKQKRKEKDNGEDSHSGINESGIGKKRRISSANEHGNEKQKGDEGTADAPDRKPAKKRKKADTENATTTDDKSIEKESEVNSRKAREQELEQQVRRLMRLDPKTKVDLFLLRSILREKACVKSRHQPKRKIELLELVVQWATTGDARPALAD